MAELLDAAVLCPVITDPLLSCFKFNAVSDEYNM